MLLWKRGYRKFSDAEWVATGVGFAMALGSLALPAAPERWASGGIVIDEDARRVLRPSKQGWRLGWRDTSDVFLSVASTYPYLVDALTVAWWHRGSTVVAEQMAMMNLEAMAITAGIQGMVSGFVSRERPYGRECRRDETFAKTDDCERYNRYRSFFSGHASQAFVAAALTCAHHSSFPLYGSRTADQAACVAMFALATATGMLRVVADQHYVSDVTIGALLGTAIGFGVPYLLHYRDADPAPKKAPAPVTFTLVPTPVGLSLTGVFR